MMIYILLVLNVVFSMGLAWLVTFHIYISYLGLTTLQYNSMMEDARNKKLKNDQE
jgi:hypothetical protein